MSEETNEVQVEVRSAPKFLAFGFLGVVVGVLAAAIVTLVAMSQPVSLSDQATRDIGAGQAFGLLAIALGLLGLVLGLFAALIIDRYTRKHAKLVDAVHKIVTDDTAPAADFDAVHPEFQDKQDKQNKNAVADTTAAGNLTSHKLT